MIEVKRTRELVQASKSVIFPKVSPSTIITIRLPWSWISPGARRVVQNMKNCAHLLILLKHPGRALKTECEERLEITKMKVSVAGDNERERIEDERCENGTASQLEVAKQKTENWKLSKCLTRCKYSSSGTHRIRSRTLPVVYLSENKLHLESACSETWSSLR